MDLYPSNTYHAIFLYTRGGKKALLRVLRATQTSVQSEHYPAKNWFWESINKRSTSAISVLTAVCLFLTLQPECSITFVICSINVAFSPSPESLLAEPTSSYQQPRYMKQTTASVASTHSIRICLATFFPQWLQHKAVAQHTQCISQALAEKTKQETGERVVQAITGTDCDTVRQRNIWTYDQT